MCRKTWGVQPRRKDWATIEWGGREILSSSNIVFSNGLMDPWHGIGVLEDLSDSLVAVVIPEVGWCGVGGRGITSTTLFINTSMVRYVLCVWGQLGRAVVKVAGFWGGGGGDKVTQQHHFSVMG